MDGRRRLLPLLLLAALALGGCELGPVTIGKKEAPKPTKAAFLAKAEAVCATAASKLAEKGFAPGKVPAGATQSDLRDGYRIRRASFLEIRELDHPAGDDDAILAFTDPAIAWIDDLTAASQHAQAADDPKEVELATSRAGKDKARAQEKGKAYGFTGCVPE